MLGRITWLVGRLTEAAASVVGLRAGTEEPRYALEAKVHGVSRILVGTYAGNYKARHALEKAGYRLAADSEALLRAYYGIPEDRLRSSVTYVKLRQGP